MVVAIIALVVAAGGTAFAAAEINGKDLINNTVGSNKVKNQSLRRRTSRQHEGQAQGRDGRHGPQGPAAEALTAGGPQGPAGPSTPATYTNPQWGQIVRNTSPIARPILRGGPYVDAEPADRTSAAPAVDGVPRVANTSTRSRRRSETRLDFVCDQSRPDRGRLLRLHDG